MANQQQIAVYVTPPAPELVAGRTLVVVDTLRATTTMTTLIGCGAARVYACPSIEAGRALEARLPGSRLCGEVEGERPEGFNYGNSPTEFESLDVVGWTMVQATTNGTPALRLAAEAHMTLVGCLRNRGAVVAALSGEADIAIVCGGEHGGAEASVEDTYTAGAIVEGLCVVKPAVQLSAGGRLARRLFRSYENAAAAFEESPHATDLRKRGFTTDLAYAAELDVVDVVPRAVVDGEGRVVVSG